MYILALQECPNPTFQEEFERLSGEVQLLRTENEVLQQQVQKNSGTKQLGPKEESKYSDSSGVLVLNKKLQDAQKIYEKVKSELSRVKQVLDFFFNGKKVYK